MNESVIIVGAGQAGGELATCLRQQGYTGDITLVGDETHPPYQRPPLSKGFLLGKLPQEALYLKPEDTYERFGITLKLGTRVVAIDRKGKEAVLSDGRRLGYDKLVLATGGHARKLVLPSVDTHRLENVFYLRSIADVDAMRGSFSSGRHLAIIGGGYVGLEVAAVAIQLGLRVTLLEAAPRLLARVTGPEVSSFIEGIHRAYGVEVRLSTEVRGFALDGAGCLVRGVLASCHGIEERIDADLVLVGIGLVPHTALASEAGLPVQDGIIVDEHACTADPSILAIGDCANQPSAHAGRRVRLESVPNAIEHARVAATTILGRPKPSSAVPWFWSEQYDLKLQMVGLSAGHERCVTRRDPGGKAFAAFYLVGDRVIAADAIGRPADFMVARRLVTSRTPVDERRLADTGIPLASVAV